MEIYMSTLNFISFYPLGNSLCKMTLMDFFYFIDDFKDH